MYVIWYIPKDICNSSNIFYLRNTWKFAYLIIMANLCDFPVIWCVSPSQVHPSTLAMFPIYNLMYNSLFDKKEILKLIPIYFFDKFLSISETFHLYFPSSTPVCRYLVENYQVSCRQSSYILQMRLRLWFGL